MFWPLTEFPMFEKKGNIFLEMSHMQLRKGLMTIEGVLDNFLAWVTLGDFRLNPSIALPK